MKIKILGSGSGLTELGKSHASLFLELEDSNLLIDCGEGTAHKLLENSLTRDTIDAIAISHFHPDHSAGIFMVLQMLYLQKRTKKLKIYLPEMIVEFKNSLNLFYLFTQRFSYQVEIFNIEKIKTSYSIIPILNDHLLGYSSIIKENKLQNRMKSYSFFIQENKKYLVYTSDLVKIYSVLPYFKDADVIIVDALHPDFKDILDLNHGKVKRIYLNHGLSDELNKLILNGEISDKFILTHDNMAIEL